MYFVYPNPKNRNKYVGVFSGNTEQDIYGMMDIQEYEYNSLLNFYGEDSVYFDVSCFGWYDYKIWDSSGNMLYSGYFDDNWKD